MVKPRKSTGKGTRIRATKNATVTGYAVVDRFLNGISKRQRHTIARALEVRSLEQVADLVVAHRTGVDLLAALGRATGIGRRMSGALKQRDSTAVAGALEQLLNRRPNLWSYAMGALLWNNTSGYDFNLVFEWCKQHCLNCTYRHPCLLLNGTLSELYRDPWNSGWKLYDIDPQKPVGRCLFSNMEILIEWWNPWWALCDDELMNQPGFAPGLRGVKDVWPTGIRADGGSTFSAELLDFRLPLTAFHEGNAALIGVETSNGDGERDLWNGKAITDALAVKAETAEVYTVEELNPLLDEKANANDVYDAAEVDALLGDKADSELVAPFVTVIRDVALVDNAGAWEIPGDYYQIGTATLKIEHLPNLQAAIGGTGQADVTANVKRLVIEVEAYDTATMTTFSGPCWTSPGTLSEVNIGGGVMMARWALDFMNADGSSYGTQDWKLLKVTAYLK